MPRGADDRFWEGPGLPSVFKHTLIDKYVPQFAGMTGSRAGKRVVFMDGFAGRGRFSDGSPASAERILRIAHNQGKKGTVFWTCFFVERKKSDAVELATVVDDYVRLGVNASAHHGSVLVSSTTFYGRPRAARCSCFSTPVVSASPTTA